MPRPPRILGDDVHYHIILRCNNKERLLQDDVDFQQLLTLMCEVKEKFGFRLYNYDLLHSHIHLMLSTHTGNFIDKIMHCFCNKYAKYFNQRHQRMGHLWGHRYRSRIISNDKHGLACLRYQHRNALSAGIVSKPEYWPWSGYHFYGFGFKNRLLEPHPSYLALHESDIQRKTVYQRLVNTPIPADKNLGLLEKGSGRMTRRFSKMIAQVERLKNEASTI